MLGEADHADISACRAACRCERAMQSGQPAEASRNGEENRGLART